MTTESGPRESDEPMYRSGVAARLAGVPVETLRVWERRYGVVGPRLSAGGQRVYTSEEVRRLSVIKQCVDMGHPIGAIANLTNEALLDLRDSATVLGVASGAAGVGVPMQARIALAGPLIASPRFEERLAGAALRVVGRCANVAEAAATLKGLHSDIVLVELATLNDDSAAVVEGVKAACGAAKALVLYRFAPSAVIRRLRAAGHEVARAPSDAVELAGMCRTLWAPPRSVNASAAGSSVEADPPPPRFDERALSDLAGASTTVYCECPHHLVELVLALNSFERYSVECASRTPDDAALHRDLARTTGLARAMMEDALMRVALAEGLPVPKAAAS